MSFGLEPLYKQITDLEKQLKDAKKEISDREKALFELVEAKHNLEAKIEAAKNELEGQIFEWETALKYEMDLDAQQLQEAAITDLKESLALLIPRKEEPKCTHQAGDPYE